MKSISAMRTLVASAFFTSMLGACTAMSGGESGLGASQGGASQGGTSQGGTGAEGQTGSAMSPTRGQCAQFHQMESRRTPTTQQELVDPQLRGLTPEKREEYMNMMREKCGPGLTPKY